MEVEEQQIVMKLESAAVVILTLSPTVNQEERDKAEFVFLNFRHLKSPYNICKYIFENTKTDYVIFEAANCLKEAVIREWDMLSADDVTSLWQYLLYHVIKNTAIAVFVREKILQVIGIIIKRSSISNEEKERSKVLPEVEQLLLSGDLHKQIVACSLLLSILQEYAVTTKSTDVGLTLETHIEAKKQFELTDLRMIFKLCMRMLVEISQIEGEYRENVWTILKLLLQIAENILTWHFVSLERYKNINLLMETNYEAENALPLRLSSDWKDIITSSQVIELFFHLHWKIRGNPHLTHCTINCLSQLASLSGPIMTNTDISKKYVTQFLQCFITFIANSDIMDREALGVSYMAHKLHVNEGSFFINEIPRDLYFTYVSQLCNLTCTFSRKAANDDKADYDVSLYDEAFNVMVKVWNKILNIFSKIEDEPEFPDNLYKNICTTIFDNYLNSHLSPPRGSRIKLFNDDVLDEFEEDDKVKYDAQLECIASFGTKILNHVLPILAKLIDVKTNELKKMYERLDLHENERIAVFEDLHWLIMLAGHVLTQEFHPQDNKMIPTVIMKYSVDQTKSVDMNSSLNLLTLSDFQDSSRSELNASEENIDHVVWLISSVLRLSILETYILEKELLGYLSPLLSSSILWFLKVWSQLYLFCDETNYEHISYVFIAAFGESSPIADNLVELILNKIYINLKYYSSDEDVSKDTVSLLIAFVKNKSRARCVVNKYTYWNIMRVENYMFSNLIKRDLMSAYIFAGIGMKDEECYTYYDQVLKPLSEEFKAIVCDENFSRNCHTERIKFQIINIIDKLIGVLNGISASRSVAISVYIMPLLPYLTTLINLFRNYHEIVHVILEFFDTFTDSFLCFLSENDARIFYDICMRIVEIYVYFNTGTLSAEKNREDIIHDDLSLFIHIVTNILSKEDNIDIKIAENTAQNCIAPVDVCMYSLKGLLPIMNVDLLKYPELCTNYFTLLLYTCEQHIEKICDQPREFILGILATIELGLTTLNTTKICCDIIFMLVKYISTSPSQVPQLIFELVQPFTNILLNLILSKQINSECIPNLSNALLCLICCYKEYFTQLVDMVVNVQPDPEIRQRLCKEFANLTRNISTDLSKNNRMQFLKEFEAFTKNTHGILFIK